MNFFYGYPRHNGTTGVRNVVIVIPGELSCNQWAKEIAAPYDNCRALFHKHGAGNYGRDGNLFIRIISGIMINPNVAGFILVLSGNEDYDPQELVKHAEQQGQRYHIVSAGDTTTSAMLVRQGRQYAKSLVRESAGLKRTKMPVDRLRIGLNCAGTDTVSAKTSHVVCGRTADAIVSAGGTVLFSELPDLIGLEKELLQRCGRKLTGRKLLELLAQHKQRLSATKENVDRVELGAFNTAGGLTTLKEKARVSLIKAGSQIIREVVPYGKTPSQHGLIVMDGPAMTDFVMTGYMTAGVHLMLSACGRGQGNKMPFVVGADMPSPILPTVKITGSAAYFKQKTNRIDFNAADIMHGGEDKEHASKRLMRLILEVASGKATRTEKGGDFFVNMPMRFYQA